MGSEGRYSNALQVLNSVGVAGHDDNNAYQDLLKRHPCSSCPIVTSPSQSSLTIDESMVLICLRAFPKGTSPGASKLRAQHLLHAIAGSTAPAAKECLLSLTRFMNHLLSGKAPSCLAPWLCGAPLTALLKKGGGIWPIAVGEVLRCFANHLYCLAVRPSLPSVFYPMVKLVWTFLAVWRVLSTLFVFLFLFIVMMIHLPCSKWT